MFDLHGTRWAPPCLYSLQLSRTFSILSLDNSSCYRDYSRIVISVNSKEEMYETPSKTRLKHNSVICKQFELFFWCSSRSPLGKQLAFPSCCAKHLNVIEITSESMLQTGNVPIILGKFYPSILFFLLLIQ